MSPPFSEETQELLDAADRAVARSRETVEQVRKSFSECERRLQRQQVRFAFLREIGKPR